MGRIGKNNKCLKPPASIDIIRYSLGGLVLTIVLLQIVSKAYLAKTRCRWNPKHFQKHFLANFCQTNIGIISHNEFKLNHTCIPFLQDIGTCIFWNHVSPIMYPSIFLACLLILLKSSAPYEELWVKQQSSHLLLGSCDISMISPFSVWTYAQFFKVPLNSISLYKTT